MDHCSIHQMWRLYLCETCVECSVHMVSECHYTFHTAAIFTGVAAILHQRLVAVDVAKSSFFSSSVASCDLSLSKLTQSPEIRWVHHEELQQSLAALCHHQAKWKCGLISCRTFLSSAQSLAPLTVFTISRCSNACKAAAINMWPWSALDSALPDVM